MKVSFFEEKQYLTIRFFLYTDPRNTLSRIKINNEIRLSHALEQRAYNYAHKNIF